MTTYVAPGTKNPYRGGVTGGSIPGDAATGHLKRLVDEYVEAYDPWVTPTYSKILSDGKKGVINQLKVEDGIKRQRLLTVPLTSNYTVASTTLTVGTTNIALLQKNMVFQIGAEIFWATADPDTAAGTIAVAFAQAGTSNAAHASGDNVVVIGLATTFDGPTYPNAPSIYGDFVYNHPQRFASQHTFDDLAIVTPDWERDGNNKLAEMMEEETKYVKMIVNRAVIYGKRQEGTLATGATRPSLMGGIGQMLTTNVGTISPNGSNLSVYHIEDITASVWSKYRQMATTMVMSLNTKRIWNRLINPYRQGTLTDSTLKLKLDSVELETGTFTSLIEPDMPDGEIWGLDFSGFKWFTYQGQDWDVRDTSDPTRMAKSKGLNGTFSMLMPGEPLMWRISGFNQTLSAYPPISV